MPPPSIVDTDTIGFEREGCKSLVRRQRKISSKLQNTFTQTKKGKFSVGKNYFTALMLSF